MKRSFKILISIPLILMVLFIINAFSLKSNWDKTDKKEKYLSYKKLYNQPFKYIKTYAKSGGYGKVCIDYDTKGQVYISNSWEDKVRVSIKNDTLNIEFLNIPKGGFEGDNLDKMVIVTNPDVKSIESNNVSIEIENLTQDYLTLRGNGFGRFEFLSMNVKNLDIDLDENSSCNFFLKKIQHLNAIKGNIKGKASLNISVLFPEKIDIKNGPETGLELNGATLNLLNKQ